MSSEPSFWVKNFGNKEMTSCGKAMKLLQAALDGELDEPTMQRVRNHFEACAHCGMEAATFAAIKASIAKHPPRQLAPEVTADLEEFVRRLPEM